MPGPSWSAGTTTLWLYFHTLRHLSSRQVASRVARTARRLVPLPRLASSAPLAYRRDPLRQFEGWEMSAEPGPWGAGREAAAARGAAIIAGRFDFLGHAVDRADRALPWHDQGLSQLWRYQLHYFDYVTDLGAFATGGAAQSAEAAAAFLAIALDWIAANPAAAGDGWHPYTVSRRLVSWIAALELFAAETEGVPSRARILESLSEQARYLAKNLEHDVRGNHLVANLRALICCALSFAGEEAERWRADAVRILRLEVAEQVLPDGGHFERNPGYHVVVLRDLVEIAVWLQRSGQESPAWLLEAVARMLDYLAAVLPPAGQLPLLKDTAWDQLPDIEGLLAAGCVLLDQGRWKRSDAFPLYPATVFGERGRRTFQAWPVGASAIEAVAFADTGHYVLRDDSAGDFLIFDAGEPCPPYLPAHAHADMLGFELTVGGRRVAVDSGVYEYAAGPWRDYFRSTRAHNTVEVAGADQSEVWGSFRTARRAHPARVTWQPGAESVLVSAEHDGYRRLQPPVTHRRAVLWRRGRFWVIADLLTGSGPVVFANHLHLAPGLALKLSADLAWTIAGLPAALWLTACGDVCGELVSGQTEPDRQGWYSERFGDLRPNWVLSLKGVLEAPILTAYAISLQGPVTLTAEVRGDTSVVKATHLGLVFECPLDAGPPSSAS